MEGVRDGSGEGNALGGIRGWSKGASWAVAGTLAYYLWVKPARDLKKEQEVNMDLNSADPPETVVVPLEESNRTTRGLEKWMQIALNRGSHLLPLTRVRKSVLELQLGLTSRHQQVLTVLKDGSQEAALAVWSCQEEEGFQEERNQRSTKERTPAAVARCGRNCSGELCLNCYIRQNWLLRRGRLKDVMNLTLNNCLIS